MRTVLMGMTLALALFVLGCGPLKYEVKGTSLATGADAVIIADVQEEKALTLLKIEAINLPPPDRVMAGSTSFAVWQRKNSSGVWTRVGKLIYNENDRKGSLEASVPELAFEVQITAEKDDAPQSPGPDAVFFQKVN